MGSGKWGMWHETGLWMHKGIEDVYRLGEGTGDGLKRVALNVPSCHPAGIHDIRSKSILAMAEKHDVPATVHVAVGCDVIHQHPPS